MKNDFFKKTISLLATMSLLLSIIVPSMALAEGDAKTEEVVLHKLLLSKDELDAWKTEEVEKAGYDATQDLAGLSALLKKELKEISNVYFAWQNENGKWIDKSGNEVATVDEALGGLTGTGGKSFDTSNLPAGKYKIVEVKEKSEYIGPNGELLTEAKAVPVSITLPVVNNNGVQTKAHVYPKNTEKKPTLKKEGDNISSGSLDKNIGDEIDYKVTTTIPANSEYKVLKWKDTMTKGLTYSNSFVMKFDNVALVKDTDYTINESFTGFEAKLTSAGLAKIEKQETDKIITLEYKAVLNSSAVVEQPEKNKVVLEYSNNPETESVPPTYTGKDQIPVEKTWSGGTPPEGVTATIELYEKSGDDWNIVETVELNATNDWKYVFENLETTKTYKVVEKEIKGYNPEYIDISDQGEGKLLKIKNNKTPSIEDDGPEIKMYGKKFKKVSEGDKKALANARFVVKKGEQYIAIKDQKQVEEELAAYKTAQENYLKALNDYEEGTATAEDVANAQTARDNAFITAKTGYKLVDAQADALVLASNQLGEFEITGLAPGTYQLVETKAPEGYGKITEPIDFEVGAGTYAAVALEVPNKEINIPQTGGMGTILFTIAGLVIMGTAFVLLRKENSEG